MNTHSNSKINKLLSDWPHGTVATQKWLSEKGISRFLTRAYIKGGWVKQLGHGAFARVDENNPPSWMGGLYAIQKQLQLPVHVGGETALRWNGYGHTAHLGEKTPLYLFSPKGVKPPAWFSKYKWSSKVCHQTTDFLPYDERSGFTVDEQSGFPIKLSSPERAILETLLLMPRYTSFEEAGHLMEGLATLRPTLVQALLEKCRSVKVKRTFLYLAERSGHTWFKTLDPSKADLGSGKRMIVPGGTFDAKYQITISEDPEREVP
jgi:hypothetical protein